MAGCALANNLNDNLKSYKGFSRSLSLATSRRRHTKSQNLRRSFAVLPDLGMGSPTLMEMVSGLVLLEHPHKSHQIEEFLTSKPSELICKSLMIRLCC